MQSEMAKRLKWLVDYSFSLCDASHGACWYILLISISFCLLNLFPCDFTCRVNCDRNIRIECHILFSIGIAMITAHFKGIKWASVSNTDGSRLHCVALHCTTWNEFSLFLSGKRLLRMSVRMRGHEAFRMCHESHDAIAFGWFEMLTTIYVYLAIAIGAGRQWPAQFCRCLLRCNRFYRFWVCVRGV